ncbi:helix-turn-helix transcriptional regulator [Lutibacter sp. B1]|uniref:helix-turn-helix domain-containing protein n=1 Tax=Lutibacter sp. B1 TaxID=2725996 RepID=UPI001456785C|nr:helix-turn-helix transcriptional regulator [Lutibacter sp. B1]NLP58188.1 helix-turn-helix transcriptional regulator [Lutibacter sp. B1]
MKNFSIHTLYKEIFETYSSTKIEKHIKKIIELDFYYPYNTTFFCITNTVDQKFEYISKNFSSCLGLNSKKMMDEGMDYFWSRFHPDDIEVWIQSLKHLMEFTMNELGDEKRRRMSYTWNYRLKNGNNKYVNIIQNTTPLQFDEFNKPVIGLAHYTVLDSRIKMDICASAKYLNDKDEYQTLFFSNLSNKNLLDMISNRERDIMRLLLLKQTSSEIGEKLFISKHTVDTHRRNILKKLNLNSTGELISYFKNNPSFI